MTMKALAIMALWTVATISIFNFVGFQNHFGNLLWSLGAALMLVVILIGNVWIFIGVAKEEPWQWFKDSEGNE